MLDRSQWIAIGLVSGFAYILGKDRESFEAKSPDELLTDREIVFKYFTQWRNNDNPSFNKAFSTDSPIKALNALSPKDMKIIVKEQKEYVGEYRRDWEAESFEAEKIPMPKLVGWEESKEEVGGYGNFGSPYITVQHTIIGPRGGKTVEEVTYEAIAKYSKIIRKRAESFEAEERWYLSDPCYAIPEDRWGDFCDKLFAHPNFDKNKRMDIEWEVDGKDYIVECWDSPGGDGVWSFSVGEFGVDAGLLAVIPEKVAMEGGKPYDGQWFDKKPTLFTDNRNYIVEINGERNQEFNAESFEAEKKNCGCGQDPCVTYGAEPCEDESFDAESDRDVYIVTHTNFDDRDYEILGVFSKHSDAKKLMEKIFIEEIKLQKYDVLDESVPLPSKSEITKAKKKLDYIEVGDEIYFTSPYPASGYYQLEPYNILDSFTHPKGYHEVDFSAGVLNFNQYVP